MAKSIVESLSKAVVDLTEETPIRVLHVDDEADFLKTAKPCLEMQGAFQVETASSVEEASEKLKKKTFDAVISDYVMPGKDGLQFLKELREEGNNVPFIIFTGKGKEEVAIKALNLGADRYLNKTGDPETVYGELAYSIRKSVKAKQAEQAVRESQQKFERLFMNNPEAAVYLDPDFHILDVNLRFERLFGYSLDETRGEHINDVIVPKDKMKEAETLDKEAKNGYTYHDSVRKRKDGSLVPVSISAAPIIIEGQLVGSVGLYKDITERKKVEERIRGSEEKYRNLLENARDAIFTSDLKGTVTAINKVATEYGFKKDEVVGKNMLKFVPKKYWPRILKGVANIARGNTDEGEAEVITPKGKVFMEYRSNPIRRGKKIVGLQTILRDVTERKKMEEKLRVVGKLTRHDVRNKLSAIMNNVYLTKQKVTDNHKALKYLEDVESAVRQTERIFDFARAYEKLGIEKLAYMDVEKALKKATILFSDMHGVNVVNDCHGLKVLADSLLRQIFYNLIRNSLTHGEKVSQIRVYYEEDGKDNLKLVYEDDGVGIPEAEKEKIFKEGYGKGTGYGLYLIKKMCEVYGWTVKETGKQGKGARFTITILKKNESGKLAHQLH